MITCACDPDTNRPAFCIYQDKTPTQWFSLQSNGKHWLHNLQEIIDRFSPHILIIENQYLPKTPDAGRRFRSVANLVSARSVIQCVFALAGIPDQLIEPFAWQQTLGGSGLARHNLKQLSMLKASDLVNQSITDHNIADAINIGFWWVTNNISTVSERWESLRESYTPGNRTRTPRSRHEAVHRKAR